MIIPQTVLPVWAATDGPNVGNFRDSREQQHFKSQTLQLRQMVCVCLCQTSTLLSSLDSLHKTRDMPPRVIREVGSFVAVLWQLWQLWQLWPLARRFASAFSNALTQKPTNCGLWSLRKHKHGERYAALAASLRK